MNLGALKDYNEDYSNCIDKCSLNRSDKTARLGYDNNYCLLGCNKFYTNLRQNNIPSFPLYPDHLSMSRNSCKLGTNVYDTLRCQNYQFNRLRCIEQCDIDKKFMTAHGYNRCVDLCSSYAAR